MVNRFYERRLYFKNGRFAGFRWQIEKDSSYSTSMGAKETKFKIRRRNELASPVYSDYMTIKVRRMPIDTLLPDKKSGKAMYDVYEVKVWKAGRKYGTVTYHKKKHNAHDRYFRIISSLMNHLKTHDHAKGWRPPKK